MKRLPILLPIAFTALLLLYPDASFQAASDALSLFTLRVFPSLFPFYVAVSLVLSSPVSASRNPIVKPSTTRRALACFLIGAVAGYPAGARAADNDRYIACCNLCSPMFLYAVVSVSLMGDARFFFPVALGHYGAALLHLLVSLLFPTKAAPSASTATVKHSGALGKRLLDAIAESMRVMLSVCGCIVFFSVLSSLFSSVLPFAEDGLLSALLASCFEMTNGCAKIAVLPLDARSLAALFAFCVSFGGLCILAQALLVAQLTRPLLYLARKTAQAFLAAAIAYLTTPLFLPVACETAAQLPSLAVLERNAAATGSLIIVCAVGVLFSYLTAILIKKTGDRIADRSKAAP